MPTPAQTEFAAYRSRASPVRRAPSHSPASSPPGSASSRASSPSSPAMSPSPTAVPAAVYSIPQTQFDANTGPKGVIADAQSYERARKRTFRQTIFGMTQALGNNVIGVSEKMQGAVRSSSARRPSERSTHSTATDGSEEEDEFMRSWREKRLQELKNGAEIRTRRQSPSKRRWGRLIPVDPVGYLDAVEKVAADTIVVVFIADDASSISSAVENGISNLARKYDLTRFVKLSYQDAEMDAATAPGVLAYCNGELVANLVRIVDEIPEGRSLSPTSLEDVLREHIQLA